MSAYGSHRVRLETDLTRYHPHLVRGVTGTSVPGAKTTEWGWQDRFWAVRYDCCGTLMDTIAGQPDRAGRPEGATMIVPVYDSTHANIGHLPAGHAAGYVTGSPDIRWTAQDWLDHPGAVRIAQSPLLSLDEAADADVLDVEDRAATLAECAPWAKAAISSFALGARPGQRRPAVYASAWNITPVVNALIAGGVRDGVSLWVADWNLTGAQAAARVLAAAGPFPVAAAQWKSLQFYDMSVFAQAWLDTVSSAPGPHPFPPGRHEMDGTGTLNGLARRQRCDVADILQATADGLAAEKVTAQPFGPLERAYINAGHWDARAPKGMLVWVP